MWKDGERDEFWFMVKYNFGFGKKLNDYFWDYLHQMCPSPLTTLPRKNRSTAGLSYILSLPGFTPCPSPRLKDLTPHGLAPQTKAAAFFFHLLVGTYFSSPFQESVCTVMTFGIWNILKKNCLIPHICSTTNRVRLCNKQHRPVLFR